MITKPSTIKSWSTNSLLEIVNLLKMMLVPPIKRSWFLIMVIYHHLRMLDHLRPVHTSQREMRSTTSILKFFQSKFIVDR
jgi:hypothetical protein